MRRNKISIIATHEFKKVARTKTFVIITIIGPFLIFAMTVLPSLLNNNAEQFQEGSIISIVGGSDELIGDVRDAFSPYGVVVTKGRNIESLKKELVVNNTLQGIVEIPGDIMRIEAFNYYSASGTDYLYWETIKNIIGNYTINERLKELDIDTATYQSLSKTPSVIVKKMSASGEEEGGDIFSIIMTSISFIMLLYMSILLYGQMIGRSIVIEKTSKTIEILLSSARPDEIMAGKIIGIGGAGLLQYAIWVIAGIIIKTGIASTAIAIPSFISISTLLLLVVFFILAFLLYASLYAALGAAAENEQNLGQLAWPLILFLVIPMVMISTIVMNPDSLFSLTLSYFPLTSPMVMFVRVLVDMPQVWEILLCFFILIVSIIFSIYFSSRIFRVGILLSGKKHTLKEIIKWMRYK